MLQSRLFIFNRGRNLLKIFSKCSLCVDLKSRRSLFNRQTNKLNWEISIKTGGSPSAIKKIAKKKRALKERKKTLLILQSRFARGASP